MKKVLMKSEITPVAGFEIQNEQYKIVWTIFQ